MDKENEKKLCMEKEQVIEEEEEEEEDIICDEKHDNKEDQLDQEFDPKQARVEKYEKDDFISEDTDIHDDDEFKPDKEDEKKKDIIIIPEEDEEKKEDIIIPEEEKKDVKMSDKPNTDIKQKTKPKKSKKETTKKTKKEKKKNDIKVQTMLSTDGKEYTMSERCKGEGTQIAKCTGYIIKKPEVTTDGSSLKFSAKISEKNLGFKQLVSEDGYIVIPYVSKKRSQFCFKSDTPYFKRLFCAPFPDIGDKFKFFKTKSEVEKSAIFQSYYEDKLFSNVISKSYEKEDGTKFSIPLSKEEIEKYDQWYENMKNDPLYQQTIKKKMKNNKKTGSKRKREEEKKTKKKSTKSTSITTAITPTPAPAPAPVVVDKIEQPTKKVKGDDGQVYLKYGTSHNLNKNTYDINMTLYDIAGSSFTSFDSLWKKDIIPYIQGKFPLTQ